MRKRFFAVRQITEAQALKTIAFLEMKSSENKGENYLTNLWA